MEKELAKIEQQLKVLYHRKSMITAALDKKAEPALIKKYVGKCYKVKNRYDSERSWWLYKKVIGVEGQYLSIFDFEVTTSNIFEAKENHGCYDKPEKDWIEISSDVYRIEFLNFVAAMSKYVGST